MGHNEREAILKRAGTALAHLFPHAWAAYVYGSYGRGDNQRGSDLDLAVLLPPGRHLEDKLALIANLSRELGREVDLVSLREAGLDLTHAVLSESKQLFVNRPDDVLGWEAERMSDYADFNPRRAGIVARYMTEPLHTST